MSHQLAKLLTYTHKKVRALFVQSPSPGHGYDHAKRVGKWAVAIAKSEGADPVFNELIGVLHDIGRAVEKSFPGVRHHELSYVVCREWFKADRAFDVLTKKQKLIVLYALRYHWNNAAEDYFEAIILRDADKLDALGAEGLKRAILFNGGNVKKLLDDFRTKYDLLYWLITPYARAAARKGDMMKPIDTYYQRLLKKQVKPIDL